MLNKLVDNASSSRGNHVKGVLADAMYDSNKNIRYLSRNHIKPGIKTRRSNSKVRSTNCHTRNMSLIRPQTNLNGWKDSVSDGHTQMDGRELAFYLLKECLVSM